MNKQINEIQEHYKQVAKEHGLNKSSTMADEVIRDKETNFIINHLSYDCRILEVGCGNGFLAEKIKEVCGNTVTYVGIDFSAEMISLATKRKLGKNYKFEVGDVRTIEGEYDIIIAQRCLINLTSWEEQKRALLALKSCLSFKKMKDQHTNQCPRIILVEVFQEEYDFFNKARNDVGLEPMKPAFHNYYLTNKKTDAVMANEICGECELVEDNQFLSSYLFGSRILYPAFTKDIAYNSAFVQFFADMPPFGKYSYIKGKVYARSNV